MSIKNMVESMLSDEEAEETPEPTDDSMTDGGGLMAEEGGDAVGDLGSLEDDTEGGFGEEEFDDMNDGGAGTDELENRLDELENEFETLSSSMDSVKTENEQIGDSVEDVEENVRKLLEIYEMVTGGVNPFTDEGQAGLGGGPGSGGSFDLVGDDGAEGGGDDIASADAEGFFEDELAEDQDASDGDDTEDESVAEAAEEPADAEQPADGESGDGTSFQELKDEYDDGDDRSAGEDDGDGDPTAAGSNGETDGDVDEDWFEDDRSEGREDGGSEATEGASSASGAQPRANGEGVTPEPDRQAPATVAPSASGAGDKPYLPELPDGFGTEIIVVEWLEYLTDASSYRETARAIDYYEDSDWIAPVVAEELREYLRGFDDVAEEGDGLTIEDHTTSLEYIGQLDGGGAGAVALSTFKAGGGGGGVQR